MVEVDESGWAPIHHAAAKNYVSSVERFVQTSGTEALEIMTEDGVGNTPLLVAVSSGSQQTVELLIQLGVNTGAVNSQRHGVIELCALHRHTELLDYFINLQIPQLNVYKNLITLVDSNNVRESFSAVLAIEAALANAMEGISDSRAGRLIEEGLVQVLLQVLEKNVGDDVKEHAIDILQNILKYDNVMKEITQCNGFHVLVHLIQEGPRKTVLRVMHVVDELASEQSCVEGLYAANAIPALVKLIASADSATLLETRNRDPILISAVHTLGLMAKANEDCKDALGHQEYLPVLVSLLKETESRKLLMVLSSALAHIVTKHQSNQDAFIRENGAAHLIEMEKSKHKVLQICAINLLNRLVEGNLNAQRNILESNGIGPLLSILKQTRTQHTQEAVSEALWAVAGTEEDIKRAIASKIGVNLLVEFLGSQSYKLHLIGTVGLSLLLQSPYDIRNSVASANGVLHLTRLLQSHRENVVTNAIQALRHMCLGVGNIPHRKTQAAIANSKGLKFLVVLMIKSRSELIQVEAACTVAAVVLGNSTTMELLYKSFGFSYVHILRLLYSANEEVRLLAGAALATFAFNSVSQQREIVDAGGVRWRHFEAFLQSGEESHRVHAAFQSIVLARIIPDQESANTSATGIKILVDALEHSSSAKTVALAADCVARLAHTRAGIPDALVSIDVIPILCQLLSSSSIQVQGCAAIALRYLSFNPQAERQLLKRCREEPHCMKVLLYYSQRHKMSSSFLERWRHLKDLGLPPIRNKDMFLRPTNGRTNNKQGHQFAVLRPEHAPALSEATSPWLNTTRHNSGKSPYISRVEIRKSPAEERLSPPLLP
ncbi:ankyrin and armadillo repeat-containing protein-like [Ambystoma mexicanum]|uniref:ankyrin and armadillo repeat-containing protein-like n=1 Tax=Ambystoma mexicanum TaxID=8296 RepID=UPI0037E772D8